MVPVDQFNAHAQGYQVQPPNAAKKSGHRAEARLLAGELLEHLRGTGETITGLTDGDVENELLNLELAHHVVRLLLRRRNASAQGERSGNGVAAAEKERRRGPEGEGDWIEGLRAKR